MGIMPTPGDIDSGGDMLYDQDTGERKELTDEQQDALDEYEQAYYRYMENAQEVIEAFGFKAPHGYH